MRFGVAVLLAILSRPARAQDRTPLRLEAGPLKLDICINETAQLFHVVDQISQWSEFSHRQYIRYFETLDGGLSKDDLEVLAEHSAIRKRYGWGQGPEQVFYTFLSLEEALQRAVASGILTSDEARVEERVLTRFRPRVRQLMSENLPFLEGFVRSIQDRQSSLSGFSTDAARFVGSAPADPIPVYLIVNPDDTNIGGGYNGGFLTLEIPRMRDVYPTLLHELFHAFIKTKQSAIESVIHSVPRLTFETLNEGMAYALSPGLYHTGDSDQLQAQVAGYISRRSSLSDSYTRFSFYGLALRPLLKEALTNQKETLETFLPRAVDAWMVLIELDRARSQ
jgi:hypothetical protein